MGDKTVRKSNPITRFLILIVVRIPEKTFVVDVWEKETAFTKLLKRTTAGGEEIIECWFEERESEREAFFLIAAWMDGWMGQTNKNRLTGGEREREREREAFSFSFLYRFNRRKVCNYSSSSVELCCVVVR